MTWTIRPRSEDHGLSFIKEGQGPSLLLLHGVGLCADAWAGQIDRFARDFGVIAPDMPGHGTSKQLPQPATLRDFTDRIALLIREPAIVCGHSMGSMIALDLAARYPDRVKGVVALNSIYRRSDAAKHAVRMRVNSLDAPERSDSAPTLERWFGAETSAAKDACKTWLETVDPEGYRAAYRIFAEEDGPADSALRTLDCPALFMTGGLEPNSTPEMSQKMATLTPEGRAHIIEDSAHMMPMTHIDQVNDALAAFIREIRS